MGSSALRSWVLVLQGSERQIIGCGGAWLTGGLSLMLWGLSGELATSHVLAQPSDLSPDPVAQVSLGASGDASSARSLVRLSARLSGESDALAPDAWPSMSVPSDVQSLDVQPLSMQSLNIQPLDIQRLLEIQEPLAIQKPLDMQASLEAPQESLKAQESRGIQESLEIQEPLAIETLAIRETAKTREEEPSRNPALSLPTPPLLLAAPQNFNPDRYRPPPEPEPEEPSIADLDFGVDTRNAVELEVIPAELETIPKEPSEPLLTIDDVELDFGDSLSNVGQGGQVNEPLIRGRLRNGTPIVFAPGYNTFVLPGSEDVVNYPLRFGWQEKIKDIPINIMGGVETFDRLRPAPYLKLSATIPIRQRAVMSFEVEHGPYKFNVETLEKAISNWRYGPSLFWQLGSNSTVFSMVRWGRYSDGNREQQSFSRLEYKPGEFSVALNVFNWRYRHDYGTRSGYFSPNDFLVVSGELAWEKRISDVAKCRLAGTLGKQHAADVWANAYSYEAVCTLKPFDDIEFDVGYSFSNTLDQATGESASNSRAIKGKLRIVN